MSQEKDTRRMGTFLISACILYRLACAPLFGWCYLNGLDVPGLLIFTSAVATDFLDGHIGRRLGGRSILGSFSDPLADLVLILTAFVCFTLRGVYPAWTLLLILVMFAQFVITSRSTRPLYDPVGKYYGVFLFAVSGLTLVLPYPLARGILLALWLAYTTLAITCRAFFLLRAARKQAAGREYA